MRTASLALVLLLLAACGSERAAMSPDELRLRTTQAIAANDRMVERMLAGCLTSLEADAAAGRTPSIDILILSGGADWGAFGAGFLRGWAERPADDPLAMPRFDLITGISTGSLIAPFTALGKHAEIDELYRNSDPSWSESRFFSSLLSGESLYDIAKLETEIDRATDRHLLPGLRSPAPDSPRIVIATADVDLGLLRLWDLAELAADRERLRMVQRAAIAIPAAFEPMLIDGTLQADAGILMQLVAIANPGRIGGLMQRWNESHPGKPMRLRYWIVVNNRVAEPPTTVQPTWHALLGRSTAMMMKAGVMAPLTVHWLQSEVLRQSGHDVEMRWIAIPGDRDIDLSIPPFDQRITRPLSDLGRETALRADPWRRDPPSPIDRK